MEAFENDSGATPFDVSGLRLKRITTREQPYAAESENIRAPLLKYLASRPSRRVAPFTFRWTLSLHKQMFGRVWKWAGIIRRTEKTIGVPAHQTEISLHELLNDLHWWREHDTFSLVEQAARLHHRAVQIHPFENGNGRWSRLLASIWLKREGAEPTEWPEATTGNESIIRGEYLAAVRAADAGDLQPLIQMHQRYSKSTSI